VIPSSFSVTVFVLSALCGERPAPVAPDVVVFVHDLVHVPGPVFAQATRIASQTFADMGIHLAFRSGEIRQDRRDTAAFRIQAHIEFTPHGDRHTGVAYSAPFATGGGSIFVRYDRVCDLVPRLGGLEPFVLAAVLSHEIAHVLEGTDEHTASGIMKEHWTRAECIAIRHKPLLFSADDVEKIRLGLSERRERRAETKPPAR
jgi:hypothetical protein